MKISQRPNQDKWKYPKEPVRSFNTHLNIALHAVRFKPQQENNNAKNAGNFQDYEHTEKYAVALCHQITFISYGGKLPLWAGWGLHMSHVTSTEWMLLPYQCIHYQRSKEEEHRDSSTYEHNDLYGKWHHSPFVISDCTDRWCLHSLQREY